MLAMTGTLNCLITSIGDALPYAYIFEFDFSILGLGSILSYVCFDMRLTEAP